MGSDPEEETHDILTEPEGSKEAAARKVREELGLHDKEKRKAPDNPKKGDGRKPKVRYFFFNCLIYCLKPLRFIFPRVLLSIKNQGKNKKQEFCIITPPPSEHTQFFSHRTLLFFGPSLVATILNFQPQLIS